MMQEPQIISTYTLGQAVEDGVLYIIGELSNGMKLVATVGVYSDFKYDELIGIYKEFWGWKINVEPKLNEEDRLFSMVKNDKKIWVIEDGVAYTIMYPEEY